MISIESRSTYLPTYLPVYLPTYLPTCLPTYLPTHLSTYLPTYLPGGRRVEARGGHVPRRHHRRRRLPQRSAAHLVVALGVHPAAHLVAWAAPPRARRCGLNG